MEKINKPAGGTGDDPCPPPKKPEPNLASKVQGKQPPQEEISNITQAKPTGTMLGILALNPNLPQGTTTAVQLRQTASVLKNAGNAQQANGGGGTITDEDLKEYEAYKQKLLSKQKCPDINEAGILNNDDALSSSSSEDAARSMNGGDDDQDEGLVAEEDDDSDEDYDDIHGMGSVSGSRTTGRMLKSRGFGDEESQAKKRRSEVLGLKTLQQGKQMLSTVSTQPSTNLDESYLLNMGNAGDMRLKPQLPIPSQSAIDQESTKVEAESDRGGNQGKATKKRKRVKKESLIGAAGELEDTNGSTKKKKRKVQKKRLIMNVAQTKYFVVRYVGRKVYKMKLTRADDEDWDICWQDGAVQCEQLQKMKPYQRINHFPGMYALARKNHLARNLMRMQKIFPDDYKFFPQTWLLPSEYPDYRSQFSKKKNNKTYIVKPEASCQGRGIFLTRNLDDVNPYDHYVIQRYLHRPFLIEGLKFDLRIYVFLCGLDPLRVYVYKEGLSRFATEQYVPPHHSNLDNLFMHLTNYAINKNSSKFIQNKSEDDDSIGHKRSLTFIWRYLESQGHNVAQVQKDIKQTIIKTICAVQPQLAHIYRSCQPDDIENSMCFEVLGFDIMLDANLKPWILEVNHSPSFSTDSPLDFKIKKNLISDTIRLLNLSLSKKAKYKKQKQIEFHKRSVKGKPRPTIEEKEKLREKKNRKRENFEKKNIGEFELVFPSQNEPASEYQKFIQAAKQTWEEFNSGTKMKKVIEAALQQQIQQQIALQTTSQMKDLASVMTSKETAMLSMGEQITKSTIGSQIKSISSKSVRQPSSTFKEIQKKNDNQKDSGQAFELNDKPSVLSKDDSDSPQKLRQLDETLANFPAGHSIEIPSVKQTPSEVSHCNSQQTLTNIVVTSSNSQKQSSKIGGGQGARPPSGRVRIQLDPNFQEFQQSHQANMASRAFVSNSQMIASGQRRVTEVRNLVSEPQRTNHFPMAAQEPQLTAQKMGISSQAILNGPQSRGLLGQSQITAIKGGSNIGQIGRYNRLSDKSNSLSLGPNAPGAQSTFILAKDFAALQGLETPQAKSLAEPQVRVLHQMPIKPLSAFDHFIKNNSSSLTNGKDTPSSGNIKGSQTSSIASSGIQTITNQGAISSQGNIGYKSNATFQYDVDFNIKSINSTFQTQIGSVGGSQGIMAVVGKQQQSSTAASNGSNNNLASQLQTSKQTQSVTYQNILTQGAHQHTKYSHLEPSSAATGKGTVNNYVQITSTGAGGTHAQLITVQQPNSLNSNLMMMVSRDPYKPPTVQKAQPPMTAVVLERKRTHSMNRVNSAKTAGNHMTNSSGQSFYNRGTAHQNHNQYHAAAQMRQSAMGAVSQGGSLASHLVGSGALQPFIDPAAVAKGVKQAVVNNKIPHTGGSNFMVYHHMQTQKQGLQH